MANQAKKILIFSTVYYPIVGGAEVAMREISRRQPDYDFTLICARMSRSEPRQSRLDRVEVHKVGLGFFGDKFLLPLTAWHKAERLQAGRNFDLVWCMMASQASVAAAFFKKRHPHLPLLLTLQEGDAEEHLRRYVGGSKLLYRLLIKPWHTLIFKYADRMSAISRYLVDRARYSGFKKEISLVPNAVDIGHFTQEFSASEIAAMRSEFARPEEKIIITTSRLVRKNAVDDLVSALKYLPENFKLLVLGQGPDEDKLKALAREEKLDERVVFKGYVEYRDIPKYLRLADVFCRPSLSEGLGNSFIEAMAAGLPVVATPVGGIVDFLFDPEASPEHPPTGLFCSVRDPQSIARAVSRLDTQTALRQQIVKNARALAIRKYDWEVVARQMQEVFEQAINKKTV